MDFEKLKIADFAQLIELEQRYKQAINEIELDTAQIAELKSAIEADIIEFYVGKYKGKIIAMCSVSLVFSTYACKHSGIFEDFYITEEYRHKGVARSLTQFVFSAMRAKNVTSICVGCADVDLDMYKALGFSVPLGNLLTWSAKGVQ